MKMAISNIAWDIEYDKDVVGVLQKHGVKYIDIAPGKYFPNPQTTTTAEIQTVKKWWKEYGVEITGMQALLFGTQGFNVFSNEDIQRKMLLHLAAVCRIGGQLGATRLVFGSPRNRDRTGLTDNETQEIASAFFHKLGEIASKEGVLICLEPNPPCYGANFMTNSQETAEMVRRIDHPAVRMQYDSGAVTINRESPFEVLEKYAPLVGHIHISEPSLIPVGEGTTDHRETAAALQRFLPNALISIEMLTKGKPQILQTIDKALAFTSTAYSTAIP